MLKYNFRGDKLTDITALQTLQVFLFLVGQICSLFLRILLHILNQYDVLQKESLTLFKLKHARDMLHV